MKKVLIDGHYGAVSLNIAELLCSRDDLEVIHLADKTKFTHEQRVSLLNTADIVILCQSAQKAVETIPLIQNPAVKVIDTSNAFRLSTDWAYGLPELSYEHRAKIRSARFVSLPAPLALGAALCIMPFIKARIMPPYHPLIIHSVMGYSSGGSNMISLYENPARPFGFNASRQYALDQNFMQQREIMASCGLSFRPVINPMIDDFKNGIVVSVPLILRTLSKRLHSSQAWDYISKYYENEPMIKVMPYNDPENSLNGFLDANGMAGSNKIQLFAFGDNDNCLVAARFDNLGKGGAGTAVQCMNLMLGLDEFKGL